MFVWWDVSYFEVADAKKRRRKKNHIYRSLKMWVDQIGLVQ